jgi:hypothetical protein
MIPAILAYATHFIITSRRPFITRLRHFLRRACHGG